MGKLSDELRETVDEAFDVPGYDNLPPEKKEKILKRQGEVLKTGLNTIAAAENLLEKLKKLDGEEISELDLAVYKLSTFTESRLAIDGGFERTGIYREYAQIFGQEAAKELYAKSHFKAPDKFREAIVAEAEKRGYFKLKETSESDEE